MVLDPTKAQLSYYIPYSKKTVDEIISKSAPPVNKQDIRFVIKFASADCPWGPRAATRSQFSYFEFVQKWEDVYLQDTKPHAQAQAYEEYEKFKGKTSRNLTFEPT